MTVRSTNEGYCELLHARVYCRRKLSELEETGDGISLNVNKCTRCMQLHSISYLSYSNLVQCYLPLRLLNIPAEQSVTAVCMYHCRHELAEL